MAARPPPDRTLTGYILRRLLAMLPVLWVIATITFFLMHATPGGPFVQDRTLPEATQQAQLRQYNLDEPLWKQYVLYLQNIAKGDLGVSIQGNLDVSDIIRERFFVTAQLGLMALTLAIIIGIGLGTLSALNHNGPLDYIGVGFATLGASIPHFVLGAFLVLVFVVHFGVFNTIGWGGPQDVDDIFKFSEYNWKLMVLPVLSLAALPAAFIARVTRASLLEVLNQDYIRTARSKGLREYSVVTRHTIKNALIPVLTVSGPIAADLITGSFIIETMFAIPGLGQSTIAAVVDRDYAVIMGTTLFYAFIITMANLIVDISYAFVDPRIRYR